MYHATLTPIDLNSLDREAAIIYNEDRLVALAVKLADPEHGSNVGNWNVEFYASQPGRVFEPFVSLNALIRALQRDGKTLRSNAFLGQFSPPVVEDEMSAAPIEIIEIKAEVDGNAG